MLLFGIIVCLAAQPLEAAELKKETTAAFERYIGASEKRIESELYNGPFLFIDQLPETRRVQAYALLREGEILVKQVNTKGEGHPIEVPHGLIHDWIGALFIPNASLAQTLAIVQDYDNHWNIYKPEVRNSKLLERNGDHFKVFLQFYKKSLVTVVINANFEINYERFGTNRAVSRSYSTRLAEVENASQTGEREMPVDGAHGYLWRLYTYWRYEEQDGGVYVQLESIGLSRSVPSIFAWLVNPLLRGIPRGTLASLLSATRTAVVHLHESAKHSDAAQPRSLSICKRRKASSRNFWRHGIVEKTRRPLESANPHNLGQDLQMPVEVVFDRVPVPCSGSQKWSVLKRQAVGRSPQSLVQLQQDIAQDPVLEPQRGLG